MKKLTDEQRVENAAAYLCFHAGGEVETQDENGNWIKANNVRCLSDYLYRVKTGAWEMSPQCCSALKDAAFAGGYLWIGTEWDEFRCQAPTTRPISSWKLPTPPVGKNWQGSGWKEEYLPKGYRPLLTDEKAQACDWHSLASVGTDCRWVNFNPLLIGTLGGSLWGLARTQRPLPKWKLPDAPEGERWHRLTGWKSEELTDGYRPLLYGETREVGDEIAFGSDDDFVDEWEVIESIATGPMTRYNCRSRTKRPLPGHQCSCKPWKSILDMPEEQVVVIYEGSTYIATGCNETGIHLESADQEITVPWEAEEPIEWSVDGMNWITFRRPYSSLSEPGKICSLNSVEDLLAVQW